MVLYKHATHWLYKYAYTGVVLGIELLAACQGMEFLRPLKTTPPLEAVYELVRSKVKCVISSLCVCA